MPRLLDYLMLVTEAGGHIVVDLSQVGSLGRLGFVTLVEADCRARAHDGQLVLADPSPPAAVVLHRTAGLHRFAYRSLPPPRLLPTAADDRRSIYPEWDGQA